MIIKGFLHKGLKRLYLNDDPRHLPSAVVDKIRKILSFLQDMEGPDELRTIPSWNVHLLSGDRKGTWSLHVTGNWRVTFQINEEQGEIFNVNYEDYH